MPRRWTRVGGLAGLVVVLTLALAGAALAEQVTTTVKASVVTAGSGHIFLTISPSTFDFGTVDPSGTTSSAGVAATTDDSGAYYVKDLTVGSYALTVDVRGVSPNRTFRGMVAAALGSGNTSDLPLSSLRWRLDGTGEFTPFSTGAAFSCFPTTAEQGGGEHKYYYYDYELVVPWTSSAGTYQVTVTYTISING